jgi:hypothetical protein
MTVTDQSFMLMHLTHANVEIVRIKLTYFSWANLCLLDSQWFLLECDSLVPANIFLGLSQDPGWSN